MIRRLLRPAQRAGLRVHGLLARPAVGHPPEGHSPGDRPSLASLASLGTRLGQIESSLPEGLAVLDTPHLGRVGRRVRDAGGPGRTSERLS